MTTKSALKSKTIWGILIAALPTVLGAAGVFVPPELVEVLVAIGSALGVYGRFNANQAVSLVGK